MQKMFAVVLTLLGLSSAAYAQPYPTTFYNDPTGWAAVSSGTAYNPVYDSSTSVAANYVLDALGDGDLFASPTHTTQGSTQTWTETTTNSWATAAVKFTSGSPGTYSVTTSEDGTSLSCSGNPEYDYLLGPNVSAKTSPVSSSVVTALHSGYTPGSFPTLDELASIKVSGQIQVNSLTQSVTQTTCGVNHINLSYSFNLYDPNTNPPQTIEYQFHLGHFCYAGSPDYTNCLKQTYSSPQWYIVNGTNGVLAVSDPTSSFSTSVISYTPTGGSAGAGPLTTTGTINFTSADFLPRFISLIQNNPYGTTNGGTYDVQYKDWKITSLGYGTNMWGDSAATISYSGLNIAPSCNTLNCN